MEVLGWLWGHKEVAIFDVWSIEHILAGLSMGALVIKLTNYFFTRYGFSDHPQMKRHMDIYAVLFISYLWETVEHYLETGLLGGTIEFWFAGVEMWGNRIITDPLMVVIGYLIAKKYPQAVWPARILSVIWLFFHIIIFPHSMYLHTF